MRQLCGHPDRDRTVQQEVLGHPGRHAAEVTLEFGRDIFTDPGTNILPFLGIIYLAKVIRKIVCVEDF